VGRLTGNKHIIECVVLGLSKDFGVRDVTLTLFFLRSVHPIGVLNNQPLQFAQVTFHESFIWVDKFWLNLNRIFWVL